MLNTESLLTSKHGFCLPATKLQRAIYRLSDGRDLGDFATDPVIADVLGGPQALAKLPRKMPREFYLIAGIRTAKSIFAAAKAITFARNCDLSGLRPGETARVSIVSTSTELAQIVYDHLRGTVMAQPALTELCATEFRNHGVRLYHPSGAEVEVKVVAGAKAGSSLVGRWSAGIVFDEFPRMSGVGESVVNFDACRAAVIGRLVPGAQLIGIGSPHAETGPAYAKVNEHWGHPSEQVVVVYGAPGPAMNPVYFTAEKLRELEADPLVYRTDVEGKFAAEFAGLFATGQLERCLRKHDLQMGPKAGWHFVAAMDPATRTDAWTLVLLTRDEHDKVHVVLALQWKPRAGAPLKPKVVLAEIAAALRPYGVRVVITDQWAADALRTIGHTEGIYLSDRHVTQAAKVDAFDALRILVGDEQISIPDVEDFADDLRRVRRVITKTGIAVDLPRARGRHCDYAAALALGLTQTLAQPEDAAKARETSEYNWQETEREWLTD